VIKVLADGLPGRADFTAEVPLRGHAVEVSLCAPQSAMNESADVLASPGFWIAADVDAEHKWPLLRLGFYE
jgi:hypothetical protein